MGLPKHDNVFQVINHLRKKLSSPLQDSKTVKLSLRLKDCPLQTQPNVQGTSKAVRPLNKHAYKRILEMTKITAVSAAYVPPSASCGFFVQKKQMIPIKTHMAHNYFGNTLSDKGVCAFSLLYSYCPSQGAQKTKMLILQERGFKMQISNLTFHRSPPVPLGPRPGGELTKLPLKRHQAGKDPLVSLFNTC